MRRLSWRLTIWAIVLLDHCAASYGAFTGVAGMSAPIDNMQPSLALNYLVRIAGPGELGEIVPFAGSFAPAGWAFADGRPLAVDQNLDLFQRLGTLYGGDGVATFALPDLRGRMAVHRGGGVGLTNRSLGIAFGAEANILTSGNMTLHTHRIPGAGDFSAGYAGQVLSPLDNSQPSLAVNYGVALTGTVPTISEPRDPSWYGQVRMFAGTTIPTGFAPADGQLLPLTGNFDLLAILSNRYGGDGVSGFGLPDLRGRTPIHVGSAAGPGHSLGSTAGTEVVMMTPDITPPHQHTLAAPVFSTSSSIPELSGQPYDNMQPSLALNYIVCLQGNSPSEGLGAAEPFVGEVALFAGEFAPAGWARAEGQVLPVDSFATLFSVVGSAYGGDGVSTFALPDLRGRAIVGAGQGAGLTARPRGAAFGAEMQSLTVDQLPSHVHPYNDFDADFNSNGIVEGADFLLWQRKQGLNHSDGNADSDNDVDGYDLAIWKTQFGGAVPRLDSVAEPGSGVITMLWVAGLLASRPRSDQRQVDRGGRRLGT